MADYNVGGTEEENDEIRKLQEELSLDPDKFEAWEKLIRTVESLEGGLNRNSSPQAISTLRASYDDFLAKFPLLFGYWKKYADLEFSIGGTEAAEMVYERGVASIPNSVDLWTNYCGFKVDTSHDYEIIRELFERGAANVGLDFLAHLFWDKYLEFEDRAESPDKVFAILDRVIHIPMHQYARYFERFRTIAHGAPVSDLLSTEVLTQYRQEIEAEAAAGAPPGSTIPLSEGELDQRLRARVDNVNLEIFNRTQTETMKRWQYESEIKRPYFVVTELDEPQISNWKKYLDFEEAEGNFQRVVFLYERCLVTCAFYSDLWFRYVRWMNDQPDKEEEVRNIYQRAATIYVPIAQPGIRLQYAKFEELSGRYAVAVDIHKAILDKLPGHLETITSFANLRRRHHGLDAGIETLSNYINGNDEEGIGLNDCDSSVKGALVTIWARMLWKNKGSSSEARLLFQKNKQHYLNNRYFWFEYLKFEMDQTGSEDEQPARHESVKRVVDEIRQVSSIPSKDIKYLAQLYMKYLDERGGKDMCTEYLLIDTQVNGPRSVQHTGKTKTVLDAKDDLAIQPGIQSNGQGPDPANDWLTRRGENPYATQYEQPNDQPLPF